MIPMTEPTDSYQNKETVQTELESDAAPGQESTSNQ